MNPAAEGIEDLRATYSTHLDGVVLAKVDGVEVLDDVTRVLAELVPVNGTRPRIMALVETARGLRDIEVIARHGTIDLLQLGELDLAADLGLDPDVGAGEPRAPPRPVACRRRGGGRRDRPPLGAVSPTTPISTAFVPPPNSSGDSALWGAPPSTPPSCP